MKFLKIFAPIFLITLFSFWGYFYMKGTDFLKPSARVYHVYFSNVQGLAIGRKVAVNGYQIGQVSDIHLERIANTQQTRLKVTFKVQTPLQFSKNTKILLSDDGLIGGKFLDLHPVFGGVTAVSGDVLPAEITQSFFSKMQKGGDEFQNRLLNTLENIEKLSYHLNQILNENTQQKINASIENLHATTKHLNKIAQQTENLIGQNQQKITDILTNTARISHKINNVPIDSIAQKTLRVMNNLQAVTDKINGTKGTLGKMLNDDAFYNNLNNTLKQAQSFIKEVQLHPKRFVHFSVFGKKNKPYLEK